MVFKMVYKCPECNNEMKLRYHYSVDENGEEVEDDEYWECPNCGFTS